MNEAPSHPVFVSGPPGVGKSAVGRRAAELLKVPFFDTDHLIRHQLGASPAQILQTAGERVLRTAEAEALKGLDFSRPSVVALGGGTLTRRETHQGLRHHGLVLGLAAPPDQLWARIAADAEERPLAPSPSAFRTLLENRDGVYRSADAVLDATGQVDQVAAEVAKRSRELGIVRAQVGDTISRVLVGVALETALEASLRLLSPSRPVLFIEDEAVPEPNRNAYFEAANRAAPGAFRFGVPGGEGVKTWETLGSVLELALQKGCGRQSVVVGLGGGATCDLAGCAAGLLGRGADLVLIPSTLLAQADASVGGKCAVNTSAGKNLVGLFHPARDVLADATLLHSLPEAELRSGWAEVFKMAVIRGGPLWEHLAATAHAGGIPSPEVIRLSIAGKAAIVQDDPFERGVRKTLNLGHTLGHALERATGFGMRHGDAVAQGLAAMVRWSVHRGFLGADRGKAILDRQASLGLPIRMGPGALEAALPHLRSDKKGSSRRGLVVGVRDVGDVDLIEVEWAQLGEELSRVENLQ
ncbi:MAG: bifunctional shikimate kinase/3-dehydroquinate synthase [Myxococcota bacterium]